MLSGARRSDAPDAGQELVHNSLWSPAGIGIPIQAALALIPLLVQGLGLERFGLLALLWMGVGYFSLFDLGLGKALTNQIATRLANNNQETISSVPEGMQEEAKWSFWVMVMSLPAVLASTGLTGTLEGTRTGSGSIYRVQASSDVSVCTGLDLERPSHSSTGRAPGLPADCDTAWPGRQGLH